MIKFKNYHNRLRYLQNEVSKRVPQLQILDFRNGKYYKSNTDVEVDIENIQSGILIIDDIPCDEDLAVSSAPPESLKRGEEDWQEKEYQTNE